MRRRSCITDAPQILSGWKDIANYLGKGVRTVQRYEREHGLPIHRPGSKSAGSVVAMKHELDEWVTADPIRQPLHLVKPPAASESTASVAAIREGVAEMVRLRQQMRALRNQLRSSVSVLGQNIRSLRYKIMLDQYRQFTGPDPVLELEQRSAGGMDVFRPTELFRPDKDDNDILRRKAS